MNRFATLALCAVFAISCRDPLAKKRHDVAAQHAAEAETALHVRDFGRASLAAKAAAEADPFDPAMQDLALRVRLTTLARSPEAASIDRVADLDYAADMLARRDAKHRTDYLLARGQLALAGNAPDVAQRFFQEALTAPDAGAAAPLAMGRAESRRGNRPQATKLFEDALKAEPGNPVVLVALGQEQLAAGNVEAAAKTLAAAAEQQGASPAAHRLYGLALFAQRKVPEAGLELQRAAALDPKDGESQRALGDWLLMTGQVDRAQGAYENASRLGAEPQATFGLAQVALRKKDDAKAAPLFAGVAASEPGNLEAAYQAAAAFERLGRKDEAGRWYARYVQAASPVPSEAERVAEASRRLTGLMGGAKGGKK